MVDSNQNNIHKSKLIGLEAINKFRKQFGENGSFRLVSHEEMNAPETSSEELFSHSHDYSSLNDIVDRYPSINEFDVDSDEKLSELLKTMSKDSDSVPLFIKKSDGDILIFSPKEAGNFSIKEGCQLIYIGKPIKLEETT